MQVIIDILATIGEFVVNLTVDLVQFGSLATNLFKNYLGNLSWLPSSVAAVVGVGFTVLLILRLAGRDD